MDRVALLELEEQDDESSLEINYMDWLERLEKEPKSCYHKMYDGRFSQLVDDYYRHSYDK